MSGRPETIDELRAELSQIDARLAELRGLTAKRARIASLVRQWEALYESGKKKRKVHAIANMSAQPTTARLPITTGDYAEQAIKAQGPLPIADLVDHMRLLGWNGSGDNVTDRKRVYVSLYDRGKSKRFVLEQGLWKLKEEAKAVGI
jgi:hypothetical protein